MAEQCPQPLKPAQTGAIFGRNGQKHNPHTPHPVPIGKHRPLHWQISTGKHITRYKKERSQCPRAVPNVVSGKRDTGVQRIDDSAFALINMALVAGEKGWATQATPAWAKAFSKQKGRRKEGTVCILSRERDSSQTPLANLP